METQQSVGEWIDTTFPGTDPESPRKAIRALEEMVELCLASGASYGEVIEAVKQEVDTAISNDTGSPMFNWLTKRPTQKDKIPAEAADVLIVLYGVAHMRGFDLHAEVEKKMAVNRKRKWAARGDGTGYHIKDGAK